MSYAIDTEGTRGVGSTLLTTGLELRDCGTAFAYAGGLVRSGIGADHPALPAAIADFVATHQAALEAIAAACSGLGQRLTWAAQSGHEVEISVATGLGLRGAVAPGDSVGVTL